MDKVNDLGQVKGLMDGGDEVSLEAGKWSEWKFYPLLLQKGQKNVYIR